MEARDIIQIPAVTEKNNRLRMEQNIYVFRVHPAANKIEIKRAIESVFSVEVTAVRTQNMLGKIKRMGRFAGRRSSWKKAIVKLKEGQSIPIFEGA